MGAGCPPFSLEIKIQLASLVTILKISVEIICYNVLVFDYFWNNPFQTLFWSPDQSLMQLNFLGRMDEVLSIESFRVI